MDGSRRLYFMNLLFLALPVLCLCRHKRLIDSRFNDISHFFIRLFRTFIVIFVLSKENKNQSVMEHQLTIYNTLDRRKELFVPLHAPHVGMYVVRSTCYGDPHLGHARPSITFDLLFRYLTHLGTRCAMYAISLM